MQALSHSPASSFENGSRLGRYIQHNNSTDYFRYSGRIPSYYEGTVCHSRYDFEHGRGRSSQPEDIQGCGRAQRIQKTPSRRDGG